MGKAFTHLDGGPLDRASNHDTVELQILVGNRGGWWWWRRRWRRRYPVGPDFARRVKGVAGLQGGGNRWLWGRGNHSSRAGLNSGCRVRAGSGPQQTRRQQKAGGRTQLGYPKNYFAVVIVPSSKILKRGAGGFTCLSIFDSGQCSGVGARQLDGQATVLDNATQLKFSGVEH